MRNLDRFFWGASTSAYQVEGGNKNDWSEFGMDAGKADDHYNRFQEDFDLAKSLGHNAHRFSIEWSRIEPEEGKFNQKEIEHYRKVISSLREKGLEPFVTLWHFTNPIWFSKLGGFGSKKSAFYFERYADFVTRNLKGVKFWLTINEPMVYATNAYLRGIWPASPAKRGEPPRKKSSPLVYFKVIRNLAAAHRKAYAVVHKNISDARVGIAKNIIYFEAAGWNPGNKILKKLADWWWNRRFLNQIQNLQDFIGLNYYFRNTREIYPEGLYHVLLDLKKYQKPIYITENGLADAKDEKRARFIKDHIYWMKKAMSPVRDSPPHRPFGRASAGAVSNGMGGVAGAGDAVDVRGYFHWSLIDNFEWEKGFVPRFGLVEVDYKTMRRKVRPSAYEYKKIIQA